MIVVSKEREKAKKREKMEINIQRVRERSCWNKE
jgi:hypothetical protein